MRALVLGGADCVWGDLAALERLTGTWDGLVMCVNDVGVHWTRAMDHWVSLHPEKFRRWTKERSGRGHPVGYVTWGRETRRKLVDRTAPSWGGGSSGLLAISVAHELGCTHVVLCGVPMTRAPHFRESMVHVKGRKWSAADSHWKVWRRNEERLQGWVRSMSGRTREMLGGPTLAWLEEEAHVSSLQGHSV